MRLIFMGTPDFCLPILEALKDAGHDIPLIVSMPDKPVGRKQEMKAPPVKEWAISNGLPVFQPVKVREPEAVKRLRDCEPDIIVVAAYGALLSKEILDLPRFGCVNIHASLLPKYRGAAPIQWAILNGDEQTGITIMQMDVGLDDGDILYQKEIAISPDDTGGSLFDKLAILGGEAILTALEGIENGTISPVPQDEHLATKVGKIDKTLGKLDFTRPAVELERRVRGLFPWPGTYCTFRGKSLKVISAEVVSHGKELSSGDVLSRGENVSPGETMLADKTRWIVAAGEDALSLRKVQIAGKRAMSVDEFLRGYRVEVGERLT